MKMSEVRVTLRNPLEFTDQLQYTITPDDHQLARDWVQALKTILSNGNLLEKNFCFLGFPKSARTVEYLCDELNKAALQINLFNRTRIWQDAGLSVYIIEDYFTPDTIRFGSEYPPGYDHENLGMGLKHGIMNRLHNHFEHLQGTLDNISQYYLLADLETKHAIRQLNWICHELESLVLSQRKLALLPDWVLPSQITAFSQVERHDLTDEHRQLFKQNGYDRRFGHVYMHWSQIGKTLLEVFRDEDAPNLNETVCDAITHLRYYSGEFDVEWGNDMLYNDTNLPQIKEKIDEFHAWLTANNLDPDDPQLSLGYLPLGRINVEEAFGTTSPNAVRDILSKYLDIYSIEVDGVVGTFDYCWTDENFIQMQMNDAW
jgi:hypothetical protein